MLCHVLPALMCCLTHGPKSSEANQPWTETSQTFSLYKLIASDICHSDGKLTNTSSLCLHLCLLHGHYRLEGTTTVPSSSGPCCRQNKNKSKSKLVSVRPRGLGLFVLTWRQTLHSHRVCQTSQELFTKLPFYCEQINPPSS